MTERAITFPKTDAWHWVNAETGVRVRKVIAMYFVEFPSLESETGYTEAGQHFRLAHARAAASDVAISMRAQIARARKDALTEYAFYLAERAAKAIEGMEQAETVARSEAEQLWSYYTNALLFRSTDPARSISWSQEVLMQSDEMRLERETRAVQAQAAQSEAQADEITRGEALAAWGQVWAGHVPAEMFEAFEAGDFATAKRLADEQVARQERETADHEARDAAEAGAWRDHLAREWYAHSGFASEVTSGEIANARQEWDEWVSQPVYPTELADRTASYAAADEALTRPESLSYLAGGLTNLALLATKDAALLPPSHSQTPQLDAGRPEGREAAWLQEKHPAHIDLLNSTASVDATEYLRLATEPQAGRFFPGPM